MGQPGGQTEGSDRWVGVSPGVSPGVSLGELGYLRISKVRLGKVRLCYMIKPNINIVILRTKAAVWTKAQSLVLLL